MVQTGWAAITTGSSRTYKGEAYERWRGVHGSNKGRAHSHMIAYQRGEVVEAAVVQQRQAVAVHCVQLRAQVVVDGGQLHELLHHRQQVLRASEGARGERAGEGGG